MDGGGESLKQQFQLLQEQQQKRLQMRLQRKEEKEQKNSAHTARSTASATSLTSRTGSEFGIRDNLDLQLTEPAPLGASYLSEELVEHLNTQIREMKDENGRLYKLLSQKDFEIKQLKKTKKDEKTAVMESQLTNETAATKIVELSKKIRELTAELESERTRSKQFQRKCQELHLHMGSDVNSDKMSMRSAPFGSVISLQSVASESKEVDEVDVKAIQDKLKATESKMAEYRNQCQVLKQEIKVAHKVLTQELGENVNIQSLLNNSGNFRGRAQQIITLQNKVEELRSQIEAMQPKSLESELLGNKTSARKRTQDDKYREELRRLERERKEAQEREAAERKTLEEDYHNLKQRMEAAKARNKVLSGEVKSVKEQMQTLMQKGHNDNELITALMKQQTQLKELLNETDQQKSSAERMQEAAAQQLSQKAQQEKNVVNQLKAIVADREGKVKALEQELVQLKNSRFQEQQEQFFINSDRTSPESQSQTPVNTPSHPPTPVVTIPMSGRSSRQPTQDNFVVSSVTPPQSRHSHRSKSAQRGAQNGVVRSATTTKPSQGDGSAMGELQYQCQEYHMLMQASNVERDRLSELLQVVQKRLNAETEAMSDLQAELQTMRRQNVELEKQLGRKGLQNTGSGKKKGGTARAASTIEDMEPPAAVTSNDRDMQELMTTLEIQKDEIDALKAALQRTLQAKEEDLGLYSRTIDETKQVFLQALRQLKQSKLQT